MPARLRWHTRKHRLGTLSRFTRRLTADQKRRLWQDLGSPDAKGAFQAVRRSIGHPEAALALFGESLKPAAAVDARQVKRWLEQLDSDDYKTREAATRGLEGLGDRIEAAVREAAAVRGLPLEPRRRTEALLKRQDGQQEVARGLEVFGVDVDVVELDHARASRR